MTSFTASQWQELEHQALIFKYMLAGIPVPAQLLLPIRRSFESMAARFYRFPSLAYCSLYGKKYDPEPGRCKRTDGKKWRCAKDAYPESKYCERHMHRGRNRSRKPVETQQTSLATASGSLQGFPVSSVGSVSNTCYGIGNRDSRDHPYGVKPETNKHSLLREDSVSLKHLHPDYSLDNTWNMMPSQQVSSFPVSEEKDTSPLSQDTCAQFYQIQDLARAEDSAMELSISVASSYSPSDD